jgi:translation initiation factor 1A
MIFKDDPCEEYAKVTKLLGNGRVKAILRDKTEKLCIIPGRFKKKKIRVMSGNVILIAIRDYQPDKADILCVYNDTQVEILSKGDHIPKFFKVSILHLDINTEEELVDQVVFQEHSDSEDELDLSNEKKGNSLSENQINNLNNSDDNESINLEDI